jgi:hypothetical protein
LTDNDAYVSSTSIIIKIPENGWHFTSIAGCVNVYTYVSSSATATNYKFFQEELICYENQRGESDVSIFTQNTTTKHINPTVKPTSTKSSKEGQYCNITAFYSLTSHRTL